MKTINDVFYIKRQVLVGIGLAPIRLRKDGHPQGVDPTKCYKIFESLRFTKCDNK